MQTLLLPSAVTPQTSLHVPASATPKKATTTRWASEHLIVTPRPSPSLRKGLRLSVRLVPDNKTYALLTRKSTRAYSYEFELE